MSEILHVYCLYVKRNSSLHQVKWMNSGVSNFLISLSQYQLILYETLYTSQE